MLVRAALSSRLQNQSILADMHLVNHPLRIIVMGVSGSGKTTLAQGLSQALGLRMKDGDELHLPESIAKMSAGISLQDADRWPWLDRISNYLVTDERVDGHSQPEKTHFGPGGIVACSALKQIYRHRIRQHAGPVIFLFLDGSPDLIRYRMQQRQGHYMQAGLLDSQLQTLERPSSDELDVITLSIDQPVEKILQQAIEGLNQAHQLSPLSATPRSSIFQTQ